MYAQYKRILFTERKVLNKYEWKFFPPNEGNTSSSEGSVPSNEGNIPPREGNTSSSKGDTPSSEGNIPSQKN